MTTKTELKITYPNSTVSSRTFSENGPYMAIPGEGVQTTTDGAFFEKNDSGRWDVLYFFKIYPSPTAFSLSADATIETLQNLSNSGWTLMSGDEAKAKHSEILNGWNANSITGERQK